jgi:peptide/nickel transport system permease protein
MMLWLLKKVLFFLLFLWAAASLIFFLLKAVPGDPLLSILGRNPHSADILRLQKSLQLDRPLLEQYAHFIKKISMLDLGESLIDRKSVWGSIRTYFPNTLWLSLAAITITLLLSLPLGFLAACHKNKSWKALAMFFSASGLAIPSFLLGIFFIVVFSIEWRLFPVSGSGGIRFLVLPAWTLGISLSAFLIPAIRAVLKEELRQPYVLLARAKGLSAAQIYRRHIFRNALLPIVTLLGLQLGALLSGAIIIENVFSWPGIGTLLITAIRQRDFPMIQGTVLFMAVLYLLLNFLVDLSYRFINPRINHVPGN